MRVQHWMGLGEASRNGLNAEIVLVPLACAATNRTGPLTRLFHRGLTDRHGATSSPVDGVAVALVTAASRAGA